MTERIRLQAGAIPDSLSGRSLLFDTNIWLFINGPFIDPRDQRHRIYSSLYSEALKSGTPIMLPQMVVGEFVGRCLRYYLNSAPGMRAKKIHQEALYSDWISDISDDLFHIIEACQKIDDEFVSTDVDSCLRNSGVESIDFNDALLVEICKKNDLVLVTDDGDFLAQDVPIASSNWRFF